MTFWTWFATYGDRLFTFISLASVALKGIDGLPPWVSELALISGILATAAHQSFFGNTPSPAQPVGAKP